MTAGVGQEAWALVMQDAEETCEQELVAELDASVTECQSGSQCFGMKKPSHPRRNSPQVLIGQQVLRDAPGVPESSLRRVYGFRGEQLRASKQYGIRIPITDDHPTLHGGGLERNDPTAAEWVNDQISLDGSSTDKRARHRRLHSADVRRELVQTDVRRGGRTLRPRHTMSVNGRHARLLDVPEWQRASGHRTPKLK
jgi:hypothetical protein